jgi:hypothetical protein
VAEVPGSNPGAPIRGSSTFSSDVGCQYHAMPLALLRVSALIGVAAAVGAADAGASTIHIRGTAYEFNNTDVRLAGATIRVAERPRLRATVRSDGTYDLGVPDRSRVTPYIEAAGHHPIYLQTFSIAGENLRRVNFQTPTDGVYKALAALLSVPLDADGELRDCAIVSTFSTRYVRDLSFRGFTAYGPHGVAGATAFSTPALPPPLYFNEQVVPDPTQRRSSIDGGVIWTGVRPGVYTIRARHPSTRFARFVATCRPGRVVNANPPWGLHELGKPMPAAVSARWSGVQLERLRVRRLPAGASVTVDCAGHGCPLPDRTQRSTRGGNIDLLGKVEPRFRAGQTLTVLVKAHGYDGKLVRWPVRAGRVPKPATRCVPLGNVRPRPSC